MSELRARLEGGVERPHWSAQIEDVKNDAVASVLDAFGWQPRLQTYASYGSTSCVRILARVLYASPETPADHHNQPVHDMRSLTKRGFRNFMSQNVPFHEVEVVLPTIDGPFTAKVRTDRSGLIDALIDVRMEPGLHEAILRVGEGNEVTAELYVYDASTLSVGVVSDVDDTVMVTLLPRPLIAAWNAFVVNQGSRRIVPGMPVLYQQLRRHVGSEQMPFVYLSTGAWNVSPFLQRFLFKNGYPRGPLLLTDWGPTNTGFFRSGQQHKEHTLASLHRMFPEVKWILVGDDGQHDPHIYSNFVAASPDAVRAVAIRELTEDQQDLAHGATRPVRAAGAAVRTLMGLVPRVWQRGDLDSSAEHTTAHAPHANTGTHASTPPTRDTHITPNLKALPSDAAAETGVPWVSGPDGFALIKALRAHGVMPEPKP